MDHDENWKFFTKENNTEQNVGENQTGEPVETSAGKGNDGPDSQNRMFG